MIIRDFDTSRRVCVIAEIGNNHEGNFNAARKLVHAAADCGVDAVKFQTFKTGHYVSREDKARFDRLISFELVPDQFAELAALARSLNLLFISTPFDLESAACLEEIVDAFKIASGDNDFYPLIEKITRSRKPIIVSTGMSDASQIDRTVGFIREQWRDLGVFGELALLHCVSSYPVPPEQANLRAIPFLRERYACTVGYSDHTLGMDAALMAVTLGSQIIEEHFTLDKHFSDYRDHQLSADPSEMKEMVRRIRVAATMLGAPQKSVQPCERSGLISMRRSVTAARDLHAGHLISSADLTWVRPGGGLPPGQEHLLIGKTIKRHVRAGAPVSLSDVE